MQLTEATRAYWVPGAHNIIDVENPRTGRAMFTGDTLEAIRLRHPGAIVGKLDDFAAAKVAGYESRPVVEIDRDAWDDALDMLPPQYWRHTSGGETWQCMELLDGTVTATYVRLAGRYFTFPAVMGDPSDKLAARVRAAFPELP